MHSDKLSNRNKEINIPPPHFLFLGIPSLGHIMPTLPLVVALIEEGCRVTYINSIKHEKLIKETGAHFIEYQSPSLSAMSLPISTMNPRNIAIELQKIFFKSALEILPFIEKLHEGNQYTSVVYDQMALWGQLFAEKYNLLSFCSNTMFLFDRGELLAQMPGFTTELNQHYHDALSALSDFFPQLKSYKDVLDIQVSQKSDFVIVYYPDSIVTPSKRLKNDNIIYLGNRFNAKEFSGYNTFTKNSLVYISLGTVFNEKLDLFLKLIKFFANRKNQVIVSVGGNEYVYKILKANNPYKNISIRQFVNQLKVLKDSSLFVTHAGFNGIYEGIYSGVPMIMIPHVPEQFFNASVIQDLQLGYLLKEEEVSSGTLCQSLEWLEENQDLHLRKSFILRNKILSSNNNKMVAEQMIHLSILD